MNEQFVLKKEVDWSVLHQGFAIPVSIQVTFKKTLQNEMPKGVTKDIKLLLNGRMFKAKLINQKFDETKYPNHKDIVQIRYNTQSELAIEL
ncbi:MAG: HNH endonuclease, partial [Bacteroidota bacterium]